MQPAHTVEAAAAVAPAAAAAGGAQQGRRGGVPTLARGAQWQTQRQCGAAAAMPNAPSDSHAARLAGAFVVAFRVRFRLAVDPADPVAAALHQRIAAFTRRAPSCASRTRPPRFGSRAHPALLAPHPPPDAPSVRIAGS